jgi:hypothetical protein
MKSAALVRVLAQLYPTAALEIQDCDGNTPLQLLYHVLNMEAPWILQVLLDLALQTASMYVQ